MYWGSPHSQPSSPSSSGLSFNDIAKIPETFFRRLPQVVSARTVGTPIVLDGAWRNLGLDRMFGGRPGAARPMIERAAFAIVAYCALDARSTSSVSEWVREDVSISGTEKNSQADWKDAAERLGQASVWERAEQSARANVGSQPVYLVNDHSAPGGEFALAVSQDCWPLLLRPWPDQDNPRRSSADLSQPLPEDLEARIVSIQPVKHAAAAVSGTLKEIELAGHERVSYCLLDGQSAGTRLIFVQTWDRSRSWCRIDEVIEVRGDGPADHEIICGYLDSLRVRREFVYLLGRPSRPPFTESDQAASAWPVISWIALLLTRQVEHDTGQPWPKVRTELQRVQDLTVTVPQAGVRLPSGRTPLSPGQRAILSRYPGI